MSSTLEAIADGLEMIWAPGASAVKVRQDLSVLSLSDVTAGLEGAGYDVCYVDLPEKISGFATVIDGRPHIVLNRTKSSEHLQFTVSHELAHHVLHSDASRVASPGLRSDGNIEFQAHQFALMWILLLASDKEVENVIRQNPDAFLVGCASLLMTAGVVLIPFLAHLLSLLRTSRSRAVASK